MWLNWKSVPDETVYEDVFGERYINRNGVRFTYEDDVEVSQGPDTLDYTSHYLFNTWYGPFYPVEVHE